MKTIHINHTAHAILLLAAVLVGCVNVAPAQEFAIAKLTCSEPIGTPVILSATITSSAFEGAHSIRVSPLQCPSAPIQVEGWEPSQLWTNHLSQVHADWEASYVASGTSAMVKRFTIDLLRAIVRKGD